VRIVYDEESFKHVFKVGDTIESWSTCKRLARLYKVDAEYLFKTVSDAILARMTEKLRRQFVRSKA